MILSLDQSLIKTGWSVFNDNELIDYGIIQTKSDTECTKRILAICSEVFDLIIKYNISIVLLEDVYSSNNFDTFKKLALLEGALIKTINDTNANYKIICSNTWRIYLRRNIKLPYHNNKKLQRKELKEMSKLLVKEKFNINVRDDVADSICIALFYIDSEEGDADV